MTPECFQIAILLTFEIFECAKNHGKKLLNCVRPPLAVSSIAGKVTELVFVPNESFSFLGNSWHTWKVLPEKVGTIGRKVTGGNVTE